MGGDPVEQFTAALDRLYADARRPLLTVVEDKTGIKQKTLEGWLGLSPARRIPRAGSGFDVLVEYLMVQAGIRPHLIPPKKSTWEKLRAAASRSRGSRRGRKSDDDGSGGTALLDGASLYRAQVGQFIAAIGELQDRDEELALLAQFCRGEQPYLWLRGEPWAGKSALLAEFMLNPPPNITVIGFFITDRYGAYNDHIAFTTAILEQLAALMPEHQQLVEQTTTNREGLRHELLTLAAQKEAQAGRRLVLVVDGLDEDTGKPTIVSLLPARPELNLRVVVASRHGPRLSIPPGHPLTETVPIELTSSEVAAGIRDKAVAELSALLTGPEQRRDVLALIAVARGLSVSELEDLAGIPPYVSHEVLIGLSGRSFRASSPTIGGGDDMIGSGVGDDAVYALAHTELVKSVAARLAHRQRTAYLQQLDGWAQRYRERGWPTETPDFLIRRYFAALQQHRDLPRMTELALDANRHERIRISTGGDVIALGEISEVHRHLCDLPDPDLITTARLARHRDNLTHRNTNIPISLPALWASLGQSERAENLAHSITDPTDQVQALTAVAVAIKEADPARADRLVDDAVTLARAITDPYEQGQALTVVATTLARTDPRRAETIARTIGDGYRRSQALESVATATTTTDDNQSGRARSDSARRLVETFAVIAEWATGAISEQATIGIAVAAAGFSSDCADVAENLARAITDPWAQYNALIAVAVGVADDDPARAVSIACSITPTTLRDNTLSKVLLVILEGADPARAESIARSIFDPDEQSLALTNVVAAIADHDPAHAEATAYSIVKPAYQAQALITVAHTLTDEDPARATALAERAETLTRSAADPARHVQALTEVLTDAGRAIAEYGLTRAALDTAETIACSIPDPWQRAWALRIVALAATEPSRAADTAHTIPNPTYRAHALAAVATAIATATIEPTHVDSSAYDAVEMPMPRSVSPLTATDPRSHSRRLLAVAWSIGAWEIPLSALPFVDPTTLQALAIDLNIESL